MTDKKTVFIEVPEGINLSQETMDRMRSNLSKCAPNINFVILASGLHAVFADGSRFGIEESLEEYGYKIWGDSKDEVLAMRAEVIKASMPVFTVEPPEGVKFDQEMLDKFANCIQERYANSQNFGKVMVKPPAKSWLEDAIGGVQVAPPDFSNGVATGRDNPAASAEIRELIDEQAAIIDANSRKIVLPPGKRVTFPRIPSTAVMATTQAGVRATASVNPGNGGTSCPQPTLTAGIGGLAASLNGPTTISDEADTPETVEPKINFREFL